MTPPGPVSKVDFKPRFFRNLSAEDAAASCAAVSSADGPLGTTGAAGVAGNFGVVASEYLPPRYSVP